jgi:peptidylprolyl isomerase
MDDRERLARIERIYMVGRSILGGVLAAMLLASCIHPPTAAVCTPAAVDTVSVSGDTITTITGLRFIEDSAGTGPALAWCNAVAVLFTAYLADGTPFDSTRDFDRPLRFAPGLGGLIDGFEQGVVGMRTYGARRLIIPPALGYGAEPVRNNAGTIIVPGNSTLVFDVEVLGIGP